MINIEKEILNNYTKNLEYLEKNHKDLYDRIKLFELAIELKEIKERYALEYKDNRYFDILDLEKKDYIYGRDSNTYSQEIVNNLDLNPEKNSFRTFYSIEYEKGVAEKAINSSIFSSDVLGTSPIIDYVNRNIPEHNDLKIIYNYIIFGTLLGLHIPLVHKKMNAKIYSIIEPSLEIFRLSLFVIDYSKIALESDIIFYIAEDQEIFFRKFKTLYYKTFYFNHYIKFCMFTKNCDIYIQAIQEILVSQPHYLYAYERELQSLQRTYARIKEGFSYIDISKKQQFKEFQDKPLLLLAAGPSLRHEKDFIKKNQSKFIIVAIYATITFLEEHNIIPDIVIQFDQGDSAINTLHLLKNKEFLSNTIFLFAAHVTEQFTEEINNDNIFMFQPTYSAKVNFGTLTSPSVGEIAYCLILQLGFKSIYLLGLDMALDPETKQAHFSKNYRGTFSTDSLKDSLENFDMRKNIIKVKGNFLDQIDTLPAYKISIDHINMFTKIFLSEDLNIYNLSNGAYFDNVKPLKTNDLICTDFTNLNLFEKKKEIKSIFSSISENSFNEEDKVYNEAKLRDAKKIKEKLDKFYSVKASSVEEFKNMIFILHEELCLPYSCTDLQKISNSYYNRTVNYIFHMFNLRNLTNTKKHIKKLQKLFILQISKIVDEYINILEESLKK
jgi:hypothetical protein